MAELRYEAFVEGGVIRLRDQVTLPEKMKVYVVVPALGSQPPHFPSPRLAHREQVSRFSMEVIEDSSDASL